MGLGSTFNYNQFPLFPDRSEGQICFLVFLQVDHMLILHVSK